MISLTNYDFQGSGEQASVVMKFTQMVDLTPIESAIYRGICQFGKIQISSGWWFQPLWKILVKWEYYSQYMESNICSKPPTSHGISCIPIHILNYMLNIAQLYPYFAWASSQRVSGQSSIHERRFAWNIAR